MVRVPKRHCVVESFGIIILELQLPGRAGIRRLVDARGRTVADAQDVGGLFVNSVDVSKIQCVSGYRELFPGCTTVGGAQHSAVCAACPGHALTHRAHSAQTRLNTAGLQRPLRRSEENGGEKK